VRTASTRRYSLWVDAEYRPRELGNGFDWRRHDRSDQKKTDLHAH